MAAPKVRPVSRSIRCRNHPKPTTARVASPLSGWVAFGSASMPNRQAVQFLEACYYRVSRGWVPWVIIHYVVR